MVLLCIISTSMRRLGIGVVPNLEDQTSLRQAPRPRSCVSSPYLVSLFTVPRPCRNGPRYLGSPETLALAHPWIPPRPRCRSHCRPFWLMPCGHTAGQTMTRLAARLSSYVGAYGPTSFISPTSHA